MSRKDVLATYELFQDQPCDVSFDTKANPTSVLFLDNAGITVQWTGTPIGEFKVFVSNDKANPKMGQPVVNWYELDFGSPIPINASETQHIINMNQLPFAWIAFGFERTSGVVADTLSARMTAKMV